MFELAPNHKFGLSLKSPVMNATGALGYGDEYSDIIDYSLLGAFVTNPVSLRPRKAAHGTRLRVHRDHLVVHTGLPNPGIQVVARRYRNVWERIATPVIVHVIATTPKETATVVTRLSSVRGVVGIELGLADHITPDRAVALVNAATQGDLPVIVRIPFNRVDTLATILSEQGASALTLTAPPRVVLPPEQGIHDKNSRFYRGRLYGPTVLPLLLETISRWARKLPVPIIACGGIQSAQHALACLNLGATAVQIDAVLWRNPDLLESIIHELTQLVTIMTGDKVLKEEDNDDTNLANHGNVIRSPITNP